MKKNKEAKTAGRREQVNHFLAFFLLMVLVITSSFILFFTFAPIEISPFSTAGLLTFGNIVFMSILFALVDTVRRYFMITRPIRRIREGLDQVMTGDFSVRIPYVRGEGSRNQFDQIIASQNRMIEELGSVETLRTDFISSVSHELKTPLAVISNYSTLMQAPQLPDAQRLEYARKIGEQTTRLTGLITNILKLNKLENQTIYPQMAPMDLTEAVCESMLDFESAWEEKGIEIETDLAEDLTICGDRDLLSLVWNNLMSNAIKFTPQGGRIRLRTGRIDGLSRPGDHAGRMLPLHTQAQSAGDPGGTQAAGTAFVQIADTGCGMDEETRQNIFRKFYQGDTSHQMQGNGLGLAIAGKVIEIHGGRIEVESSPGQGTAFTVYLA